MDLVHFALFLGLTDITHASMIFHAIDTDHNGIIDWREWLLYASISSSGTPEEKLDFQFHVFDLDEDGYISFPELVTIIKMHIKTGSIPIAALHHHEHYWQLGKRTPEDLALELIHKCDLNKDFKINRMEFRKLSEEILKLVNFRDAPRIEQLKVRVDKALQPDKLV